MFVLLFYCHIWKLIIQCPNISCHLSCDKINNSSNRNQTNATFLCWMRNILCYICRAKFGEIHHFILNEIIFYQLIYHFIIPTRFEITSKEGFCTATQVLFLKHIFSQLKRTVEKANSIHSLLHPFLLVMHIQFFLGKYPLYLQCSGQIPDLCNYTQSDYIIAGFFFLFFGEGIPFPWVVWECCKCCSSQQEQKGRGFPSVERWRTACVQFAKRLEILWGERCYVNVRSPLLSGVQMHPGLW